MVFFPWHKKIFQQFPRYFAWFQKVNNHMFGLLLFTTLRTDRTTDHLYSNQSRQPTNHPSIRLTNQPSDQTTTATNQATIHLCIIESTPNVNPQHNEHLSRHSCRCSVWQCSLCYTLMAGGSATTLIALQYTAGYVQLPLFECIDLVF